MLLSLKCSAFTYQKQCFRYLNKKQMWGVYRSFQNERVRCLRRKGMERGREKIERKTEQHHKTIKRHNELCLFIVFFNHLSHYLSAFFVVIFTLSKSPSTCSHRCSLGRMLGDIFNSFCPIFYIIVRN